MTGANKGIGKEIARGLAEKGVTVLLGARDTLRGEAAAEELATSGRVLFQQIDVTSDASVAAAVQRVDTDFGQLDILVNNAGGWFEPFSSISRRDKVCQGNHRADDSQISRPSEYCSAGISIRAMPSDPAMGGIIRTVYEVNVFGLVRVTNAFLPLLHKAPAAMVVNITSKIGSLSDPAITKMGTQFMAVSCSQ